MGWSIAFVTIVSTSVTSLPRWFGRGTPVGAASAEVVHLLVHTPLLRAVRDAEPGAAASRVLDHVEVDLAVGDAALLGDCPEAGEHRARDHQVRHEELRTLGRHCLAAVAALLLFRGHADLRVDLGQMAVHGPAVPAADELDVAVRLVVAAIDERRVVERSEMSIDEGPRPVVVDREGDVILLAVDNHRARAL